MLMKGIVTKILIVLFNDVTVKISCYIFYHMTGILRVLVCFKLANTVLHD